MKPFITARVLEIGCGTQPTCDAGWVHLDARPLPHVEYVQSAVDLSNLADGAFTRVVARDVIEHIGWRDVPHALSEWLRVLEPGGVLEVETPNALELIGLLEEPPDPELHRWQGESNWQRFCRVAFGHQDYPENSHFSYFTVPWLTELLYAAGAASVKVADYHPRRFRLEATK